MGHGVFGERAAYFLEPAWHKLGTVLPEETYALDAHEKYLNGGIQVVLRPTSVFINGAVRENGRFDIIRLATTDDPKERNFGNTTSRYNPLQSVDLCTLFDKKVNMPIETIGLLNKGKHLFITWRLPIGGFGNEEIQYYGFLAAGFNGKMGIHLYITSVRVVCWNTWTLAVSAAESKSKNKKEDNAVVFSGKHLQKDLYFVLGEWMNHIQQTAEHRAALANMQFEMFAKNPIRSEDELNKILNTAFPDEKYKQSVPQKLRSRENAKVDEINAVRERYRAGVRNLFDGEGIEITPTYWGLFNATTEYFNHIQVEKKPMGMSIINGNRADNMNRMFKTLSTLSLAA